MKRYAISRIAITCACMTGVALGQAAHLPAAQEKSYVVTLNFNAAVLATAEARKQLGDLQTKLTPRENQLRQLEQTVEAEKKQLEADSSKLSEDARQTRAQDWNRKSQQLQRETEDFQNDSRSAANEICQRVAEKLYTFLGAYSEQHGYSLVVERGTESAPIVWYAAKSFDITDDIVKAYDAKSGAPASGAPDAIPPAPGIR